MRNKKALSLLELIVVVIILVILAGLMFPRYRMVMERAKDKEAITALKAVQAGEKIYRLHYNKYYPYSSLPNPVSDVKIINKNLGINLVDQNWGFYIFAARVGNYYYVRAYRKLPPSSIYGRFWHWNTDSSNPEACCQPLLAEVACSRESRCR